ncbi:GntR family transcriptional regulator [Neglectibacter timonensis]|uniref:GntR family transcriptional regulator n=1 Tax=Neglectibacter timonensis TaxID=1776382 RepID=UPI003994BBAA
MLRIDYKSGLPIYDQIYRGIVKMAAAGAFGGDGQLPSVRSVAQELGVNPNTVQKAYGLLERDGVICSLPGKGSFLTGEQNPVDKQREEAVQKVRVSAREALDCGVALGELLSAVQAEDSRRKESEKHD